MNTSIRPKNSKKIWYYGIPSMGSKVFDLINILFMLFLVVITLYPFLYVLFASFSEPLRLFAHSGILLSPLGFTLKGYVYVFKYQAIWNGYLVTLFLATVGTACNMVATLLFAYVLSRRNTMLHSFFTFAAVFTMYFNGGLVPTYLIVKAMGLIDSIWSLIIPGLINTFYMIILRTAIMGVPQEMTESAALDGAGELKILIRIMIPLIIPTIVAIALFVMVGYWNSWTSALLYIQDPKKYPLQMVLRQILIINDASASAGSGSTYTTGEDSATRMLLKYATIIVSVIPIIVVYIPLQKYFTKGIMIGALKG
jgi:putative aldouronate transport system permease protein